MGLESILLSVGFAVFAMLNNRFRILDKLGLKPGNPSNPNPVLPSIPGLPQLPNGGVIPTPLLPTNGTPVLDIFDSLTKGRPILNSFVNTIRDLRRRGQMTDEAANTLVLNQFMEEQKK